MHTAVASGSNTCLWQVIEEIIATKSLRQTESTECQGEREREREREKEMIEKTKKDFYWFLFVYKIFKNTLKLNFSQQKRHQQGGTTAATTINIHLTITIIQEQQKSL